MKNIYKLKCLNDGLVFGTQSIQAFIICFFNLPVRINIYRFATFQVSKRFRHLKTRNYTRVKLPPWGKC